MELLKKYGLSPSNIVEAVKKVMEGNSSETKSPFALKTLTGTPLTPG